MLHGVVAKIQQMKVKVIKVIVNMNLKKRRNMKQVAKYFYKIRLKCVNYVVLHLMPEN